MITCRQIRLGGLGTYLDIDDPAAIVKGHCLCGELGLDVDMAAVEMGWAFELFELGIIDTSDTGGLELVWGNHAAAIELLKRIAYRRGLGELLANGVKRAAAILGRGSERYAMHIKGAGLNERGLRTHQAWALGIAVSARGGGHLDGAPMTEGGMVDPETGEAAPVDPETAEAIFGTRHAGERGTYKGKAKVVFWQEKFKAVVDMMGMCYFTGMWPDLNLLGPADYAALFRLATGSSLSGDELMEIGRRVHNVEKAFNTLHADLTRDDDFLPARFYEEPVESGPFAGEVLDRDQWGKMLDEYYALEGWNAATGQQTEAGLKSIGLDSVAEKLKRFGKL